MPQVSLIGLVLMGLGFCLWQWKSLDTWILVTKMVSNLLIKKKPKNQSKHNQKKQMYKYAPSTNLKLYH